MSDRESSHTVGPEVAGSNPAPATKFRLGSLWGTEPESFSNPTRSSRSQPHVTRAAALRGGGSRGPVRHAMPLRLHLHDTRHTGVANAVAAVQAGVMTLDASIGGAGGCPSPPTRPATWPPRTSSTSSTGWGCRPASTWRPPSARGHLRLHPRVRRLRGIARTVRPRAVRRRELFCHTGFRDRRAGTVHVRRGAHRLHGG